MNIKRRRYTAIIDSVFFFFFLILSPRIHARSRFIHTQVDLAACVALANKAKEEVRRGWAGLITFTVHFLASVQDEAKHYRSASELYMKVIDALAGLAKGIFLSGSRIPYMLLIPHTHTNCG
jgi:hypothetical protein